MPVKPLGSTWTEEDDGIKLDKPIKQTEDGKFISLESFVEKYTNQPMPMNWHHKLFYDILESNVVQGENGKLTINTTKGENRRLNRNSVVLAPRFHAKSVCFSINYPLWEIYRNPTIRIIIVSANEDIAIGFNRAIMNNLENNHALIEGLGSLVPQFSDKRKWGEKALIVQRDSMEKDPTVVAIGVGGKLISRRADIIIVDDLIDIDTARTRRARERTREWFENVLLPILEPKTGRLIVAGTSWYRDDIYDTLLKDSKFDIRLKLKALIYSEMYINIHGQQFIPYKLGDFPYAQKAQDIFDKEVFKRYSLGNALKGGVLWKNKWSFTSLMKVKSNMANSSFMRQYLNEPVVEEETVFRESFVKLAIDKGMHKTFITSYDNANTASNKYDYGHLIIAVGVDLAISKKEGADNTAISVWGLNEKRERILLHLDYGKFSSEETKMKVAEVYHNFKPNKIMVENIAFQEMLRQQLEADDIPVEGFTTTSGKKFNAESGISAMAMLFEQGKVIIPSAVLGDRHVADKIKQLAYEFGTYSYASHAGDILMSSWFAFEALRDFDKKLASNRGYFSTVAMVEHLRRTKAAHRVVLLGDHPYYYKFSNQSLVYIFRDVDHPGIEGYKEFLTEDEPFMIFVSREAKTCAYVFQKETNEIVSRIEGDLTALSACNLIERAGKFFNNAQIVIDRTGEGEAIYLELQKRYYPKLMCVQAGDDGGVKVEGGFKISASNLPIAIDYFKQLSDSLQVDIRDEMLVREMGELIGVEGDKLTTSFGSGQRIKVVAISLWLLDSYEKREKQMNKPDKKKKKDKRIHIPYRVFNYK